MRDQLARDCFIDSLNDQEIEWAVHQERPIFVDDAVRLALEFEAFQNGRRQRMYQKQAGVRMQQMSQNTNMSPALMIPICLIYVRSRKTVGLFLMTETR